MIAPITVPTGPTHPPNETVYIRNLEERIKVEELKSTLEEIFGVYGTVVDIVAKTNLRAKGQAFVVFDDVDSAVEAIKEIQGFEVFDKPMILDFAKTKSDATVQQNGSDEDFEAHKRRRLAEKERKQAALAAANSMKRPAAVADSRPTKAARGAGLKSTNASAAAIIPDEYLPPNKTLYLQNLPEDYPQEGLDAIFGRFDGFREVRLVPGRKGIAFVEYENEAGAISAKERTAGMSLGEEGKVMKVVYQRK